MMFIDDYWSVMNCLSQRLRQRKPYLLLRFPCLWLLLAACCLGSNVFAQYRFDNWTTEQGLPQNTVSAITQTRDGYLWFTTFDGLVRFDGMRFTVFDQSNAPGMTSNRLVTLHEDKAGALWVGSQDGGLMRYQKGRFTAFTTAHGLPNNFVRRIQDEPDGGLLIATDGGLAHWRAGQLTPDVDRRPYNNFRIYLSPYGKRWTLDLNGLHEHLVGGQVRHYRLPLKQEDINAACFLEDRQGYLWLSQEPRGVFRVKDGAVTRYDERDGLPSSVVRAMCEDRQGAIWFATYYTGLARFKDGRFTVYTARDGLPSDFLWSVYEDHDGVLWVGTDERGLSRLTPRFMSVFTRADGLAGDQIYSIYEDRRGALWFGTPSGLSRMANGKITNFNQGDGMPANATLTIFHDRDGRMWFSSWNGAFYQTDGRFSPYFQPVGVGPAVFDILQDADGTLWFATGGGLVSLRDGVATRYTTKDGLPSNFIKFVRRDRSGVLWAGSNGGLARMKPGGGFDVLTKQDGLASNRVWALHEDADGVLWFGTYDGGLSRYKEGRLQSITARDGLFANGAFHILEDAHDNFWVSSNRGIYRVSRQQLNEFCEGRRRNVHSTAYGVHDGMPTTECNSVARPGGWKTSDGKLWFPTLRGAVRIDPDLAPFNPQPPRVLIETAVLDRAEVLFQQGVELPPRHGSLEINYTGFSFTKPDYIQFKYRLEGLDPNWVEAGTRRTAYYSTLPPGNYTFTVLAANSDGVWNTEGARLRITVLPAFYQTWWFRLLAVLSAFGGIGFIFKQRLDRANRARRVQEEFSRRLIDSQEAERKRIAAELHDSLGQNLLVIKNYALMGLNTTNGEKPAREHLNEISDAATLSIEEVRQIAHNLRPYQLERLGLTNTLQAMLRQIANASDIGFTVEVDSIDGLLSKDEEISLYRIVQEAINNILKHSGASEADVRIKLVGDEIRVTIADDGRGFRLEPAGQGELKKRGFGLAGSAERVRMLGGRQTIHTAPGQGTTIHVTINTNKHAPKH